LRLNGTARQLNSGSVDDNRLVINGLEWSLRVCKMDTAQQGCEPEITFHKQSLNNEQIAY
jgi:hypothetical protein